MRHTYAGEKVEAASVGSKARSHLRARNLSEFSRRVGRRAGSIGPPGALAL
jgi:hypothetical protein